MFVLCLLVTCVIHANAYEKNGIRNVKDYILDTGLHKTSVERRIFNLKKNGIKIDVKVVPSSKDDSIKNKVDDNFPEFPLKDIGKCIIEFSVSCMKKRFVRFLETIGRLDEITLLGQDMKLVQNRAARRFDSRSMNNTDFSIERSINNFFDSFMLRITLPRWNTKREKNQIEVMLDEAPVAEVTGRGKKGGGGGGGGKGGGKCKMMMMGMLMMVKMKLMGLAAMKGMMMGGMSLMLSMMMLMQKLGKGGGGGGGGPWQSGGGGGGGGGQLKEIVLLTKSSGGGGGGPSDSYGAPPPSSYGAPSGGGGGYGGGGGGGWGRSFHKRPMMLSHDKVIKAETADGSNHTLMIGEAMSNAESIDYPDYQDYQEPLIINASSTTSNLNAIDYTNEYGGINISADSANNNSKVESTVSAKGRSFNFNRNPSTNIVNSIEKNIDLMTNTNRSDITHDTNVAYMDEWQATAEKTSSDNVPSSILNMRIEQQAESRRDVPLLRGI